VTPSLSDVATIEVEGRDDATFVVTVHDAVDTRHEVSVDERTVRELGVETVDRTRLVEASFDFLLEREPNTSILPSFELSVIGRYFPEYPRVIGTRLGRDS
jgi:hypothetical protein